MPRGMTRTKEAEAPLTPPETSRGYSTDDGNEALKYIKVGGHHITTVKKYPNNPFKPGKIFGFLETKAQLDALVAKEEAA